VKRWLLAAVLVLALVLVAYELLLSGSTVAPRPRASLRPTAVIGSGPEAVAVAANGALLPHFHVHAGSSLPLLPLSEPPKNGRLAGPVLEQARVLGAAPAALRRYVKGSHYGKTGVDVVLDSGIELRFGDDSQAARKWRAAAAVLADPSIEAVDYVDLEAPSRPAIGGSGHTLPSAP
jgi:cell division septal protein FtsQ